MKKQQKRRRNRGGFTLVEVLVVVAIIGMLAGLAVVNVISQLERSRVGAAKAQLSNFKAGITTYLLKNGRFPKTLDALFEGADPAMEPPLPPDPWGNPYKYVFPGTHPPFKFDIASFGPDGIENTDDDIANWKLVDTTPGTSGATTR